MSLSFKLNPVKHLSKLKTLFLPVLKRRGIRRLVKFGLVGLSGVGVNMGLFWVLTRHAGLDKPYDNIALVISFVAATLSNFTLNEFWTFRDRRAEDKGNILVRALKFNLISIGALLLYNAIYSSLTRFLDIYDMAALLVAIGIGFAWNFSLNILWTWRKKEVSSAKP